MAAPLFATCASASRAQRLTTIPESAILRLAERYQLLGTTRAWEKEDLEYFDALFASQWFSNAFGRAQYSLASVDQRPVKRGSVVCETLDGSLNAVLGLGAGQSSIDSIAPGGLDFAASGMRALRTDEVRVVYDSSVTREEVDAVIDSLQRIESVLGVFADRPSLLLLFENEWSLKRAYPAAWRLGQPGDVSVTPPGLPGMSFVARRTLGFSAHELTHLVVAGFKSRSPLANREIPYFAEEALARALAGSLGRSLEQLVAGTAARGDSMRAMGDTSRPLAVLPLHAAMPVPYEIDVLAALYRVASVRCAPFPPSLLRLGADATLSSVARAIASMTDVSADVVFKRAAEEMANPASPVQRRLPVRATCRDVPEQ